MVMQEQMQLADSILSKLKVISPYAILAGGAPRDWYLGEKANDLDFYLYSSAQTVLTTRTQIASALGIDVDRIVLKVNNEDSIYKTMRCLRRVFDVTGYEMPVQIMQLNSPSDEFKVVNVMSTSICKIWYNGDIHPTIDFLLTIKSGCIFIDEGYSWQDPHPKKILSRFQRRFHVSTKDATKEVILNKLLRGENNARI